MGSVYAADPAPGPVSKANEDHYRPVYSGGKLPETLTGAIVAIADKMDSICGCFSAGLIPSGASDPYALRRQGIGIIQILLQNQMMFVLPEVVSHCVFHYVPGDPAKAEETSRQVMNFLKDRMANLLADDGYSKDVIASVIVVSAGCVPILWKKVGALESLKKAPDFEPLAVAFKRVVNIIKKADSAQTGKRSDTVREDLFKDPCEGSLKAAFTSVNDKALQYLENQAFDAALLAISTLRGPVDDFFDGVMVMADNLAVRGNRLALLARIAALFETVADFSKINTP
jgi:glycyl-tRNA synthetase beta chain